MRLKDLFTVPTGQKVTEKHLRRVLISSICSILLCMTCLVSTTWAWFAVSIENKENTIQVAEWSLKVSITPATKLTETVDGTSSVQYENGIYTLQEGKYVIDISFSSTAQGNDLDQATVYLIMVENIGQTEMKYDAIFTMGDNGVYMPIQKTYEVGTGEQVKLSFSFTRMNPQIDNDLITAVFEVEEKATNESTEESTQETTDPANPSGNIDSAEPPTGDETDSATESSTEASTEAATEPSTESTTLATTPTKEQQTTPTESSSAESTTATNPSEEMTGTDSTESTEVSTAVTEDA